MRLGNGLAFILYRKKEKKVMIIVIMKADGTRNMVKIGSFHWLY